MNARSINAYTATRQGVARMGRFANLDVIAAAGGGISKSTVHTYLPIVRQLEPGLIARRPQGRYAEIAPLPADCLAHLSRATSWDGFQLWPVGYEAPTLVFGNAIAPVAPVAPTVTVEEAPMVTPVAPAPAPANEDPRFAMVAELLKAISAPTVDEEKLRQLVRDEVERNGLGRIEINLRGSQRVIDGRGKHALLPTALRITDALGLLCLVGPAGSGKSTIGRHVADALGRRFFAYSCTQGMTEGKLEGRLGFDNIFLSTPFVDFYENGGVLMLDEADALNDNARLIMNNAIANGHFPVPNRIDNPEAKRHPDFVLILGMNTWGHGSTASYTGRDTVDLATRDRFQLAKLYIDYDRQIELGIEGLGDWHPIHGAGESWTCPKVKLGLGAALEQIRSNIAQEQISGRILSTRNKVDAARLSKAGFTNEEILGIYFADWQEMDRERALRGVC